MKMDEIGISSAGKAHLPRLLQRSAMHGLSYQGATWPSLQHSLPGWKQTGTHRYSAWPARKHLGEVCQFHVVAC